MEKVRKTIIIGSGGLKIGQAGEFDYSGSQAIKALKEEGITVILINPNIATVQTSRDFADKVYFLPVTPEYVEKVIAKERPDSILLSFGGQTGLNCGLELEKKGVFKKYGVKVLGTPVKTIKLTEDRALFAEELRRINVKTPLSKPAYTVDEAINVANEIGYPVMVRSGFSLGGLGSGIVNNDGELIKLVQSALSFTNQVLVEKSVKGWKEIEYEVLRDSFDNCITVCNMENMDPMGIHTGESIVVAPSQTLSNKEYHLLREVSIKVIRHLGVVGECNIQFAVDPDSMDYRVIEVNARLSRSSALASKAVGYPLAFVAAKLSLGHSLLDIRNSITKKTSAFFEPSLDYVVVKVPKWDMNKFRNVREEIGSEMKSVGEVMGIGRSFEEALQKALRCVSPRIAGLVGNNFKFEDVHYELSHPTDKRIFAVAQALKEGLSVDEIHDLSSIDRWFLYKMKNIIKTAGELEGGFDKNLLLKAKKQGFSDYQIALLSGRKWEDVRRERIGMGIVPFVKQIDTLAAEYPASTNYLYLTYNGSEHDVPFHRRKSVIVLGSGPYRIGSSVEFDWCCVNAVKTSRKEGYETIIINNNPETVSTDYDICDRLYFDELSFERVLDIYELENPEGIIVSMGGQIPNNLVKDFDRFGVRVLGTTPENIDRAEDRNKFSALLDKLGIDQPKWKALTTVSDAKLFAQKAGYPVLVRPSYVLSGAAMSVVNNEQELIDCLGKAADVSKDSPVVISKFITNSKEIEIDAVARNGELLAYAISEHVENAGVHSGDATVVFPPQRMYIETIRKVKKVSQRIAKALHITGPFNIQFLAKDNDIKVIECNLRASRSFPFVSKVLKVNFIDIATRALLGVSVNVERKSMFDLDYVGVKSPQFSFSRLKGADPVTNVEMASTGEVACLGDNLYEAFLKSVQSAGLKIPEKNILVSISGDRNRYRFLDSVKKLSAKGFNIFATIHTSEFLNKHGINNVLLHKVSEKEEPNVMTYLLNHRLDMVISVPVYGDKTMNDNYLLRRAAVDLNVPLITNLQLAQLFVNSMDREIPLHIKSWDEY